MHKKSLLVLLVLFTLAEIAGGQGASRASEASDAESRSAPRPFPNFEAKRVAAPKPGSLPQITIQIDEPAPVTRAADPNATVAVSSPDGQVAQAGRYGWFWERVPAEQDATTGAHRLEEALRTLNAASTPVSAPRLQLMQDIIAAQAASILLSSAGTRVSPALILAVIAVESSGQSDAVSSAGATGLMQLMPDTAARFGVNDALLAEDNIKGGVRYLDWLMEEFADDAVLALAGYNAGEGAVRSHAGVPPYAETRNYVPKVLAAYQLARSLCLTPPELITDGCVFRQMK